MYERFTDRARKVMLLANEEAKRWNHEYIGAEHVLLALLQDADGVAGMLLKHMGVDLGAVRRECEEALRKGPAAVEGRKLLQTPLARDVIVHAMDHSRKLGHDYVGTDHLLLGLLQAEQGGAAQLLNRFGVTLPAVLTAMEHYAHGENRPDNQ